jgi:SNF2 family DNA or RNA helicase
MCYSHHCALQLEGVNWLLWNWWNHRSSILADEMGLGKTIQTTAFLHTLWRNELTQNRGPHLIVAPLSLVAQWQSEIDAWSPDMNVVVYHGNAEAREVLRAREWWFDEPFVSRDTAKALRKAGIPKFNVMVTTFEVALREVSENSSLI